jgi:hypothetical protein
VLSETEQQNLFDDLHYARIDELAGLFETPGATDPTYVVLSNGESTIVCQDNCYQGQPTAPAEVQGIGQNAQTWWQGLWAKGQTMDRPLRIIVTKLTGVTPSSSACEPTLPSSSNYAAYCCLRYPLKCDGAEVVPARSHRCRARFLSGSEPCDLPVDTGATHEGAAPQRAPSETRRHDGHEGAEPRPNQRARTAEKQPSERGRNSQSERQDDGARCVPIEPGEPT